MYDLPSDILEHIFQFFKVQDYLNIVARVCRRFYKIVNDSGALWRSLKTDAEFDVDSFELVIVNHASTSVILHCSFLKNVSVAIVLLCTLKILLHYVKI